MSGDRPTPSDRLGAFIDASLEPTTASVQTESDIVWPFISFRHAGRWFAVRAESVSIVVTRGSITPVPRQPAYVLGVALVRSQLVPVIDLAVLLDSHERSPDDGGHRLVVLAGEDAEIAVVADEARGVVHLRAGEIGHRGADKHDFITGEVKWDKRLVSIVDTVALVAKATRRETPS